MRCPQGATLYTKWVSDVQNAPQALWEIIFWTPRRAYDKHLVKCEMCETHEIQRLTRLGLKTATFIKAKS